MKTKTGKNVISGLLAIGLLLCGNAHAQIFLQDGSTTSITKNNNLTAVTNTFTVTAGASVLLVSTYVQNNIGSDTPPTLSDWGSQSFTRIGGRYNARSVYASSDIFYITNPAPGTHSIIATDTSASNVTAMAMQVYTLKGVDTSVAPVLFGASAAYGSSNSVTLTAIPPGAWGAFSFSWGFNGTGNYVTTTSGALGYGQVLNDLPGYIGQAVLMGAVADLGFGTTTVTIRQAGTSGVQSALALAAFAPLIIGPAAPTNLVATAQTNRVALSWNDASAGAATSYIVFRSTLNDRGFTALGTNTGNSATTYIDTLATPWTTYYYFVRAMSVDPGRYSSQASASPMGLPAVPTGLAASPRNALVKLSWNAAAGATSYNVLRSTTSGTGFAAVANVTATNCNDSPLVNETTYYYVVNATNAFGASANSAQASATPSSILAVTNLYPPIAEIRTASDTVLAVYLSSTNVTGPVWDTAFSTTEVDTSDTSVWILNGQQVSAIDKFVTEANGVDYHIYLHVPKLTNGMAYTLMTPHGIRDFVFDDTKIFCESIKVNQSGYSALSHARYANLGIWLGTGGAQSISGPLPSYTVFNQFTGEQVANGTLQAFGGGAKDLSSGDYVYRMDLSGVPEGGPYKVSVTGYGCSYPFGVGGDFSERLGYVAFRALYYQRCGAPIVQPYAWANIRPYPCHTNVYDTEAANLETLPAGAVQTTQPRLNVHGGYHDAGDADRRGYHLMVPMVLMTTYEVFPNLFTDNQFNIPDRFDANFNALGKGNGIPDILDEAVWGTMFWTNVQSTVGEPAGAVAWGSNASGYPDWGINYDQDTLLWGTETNDVNSCGMAAGLFMNLARLIQPYDPQASTNLQQRADAAYTYAGTRGTIKTTHKLYYAIQKYLLTGDVTASNTINSLYANANNMASTYNNEAGGYLTDGGMWLASYFMSYIIATNRPTNPTIVSAFKGYLKAAADKQVNWTTNDAYPVGWPANVSPASHNFNQGGMTPQGQFAYPCLMQWALTGQQQYIDVVSQLMDYDQGLNPLGKCYMTGIGFDGVQNPEQRESAYAMHTMGWGGPQPGVTVYGPIETNYLDSSGNIFQIPPERVLPRERCYLDHLGFWNQNEFTVYQSEVFPAAIYPVLAQGGTWSPAREPFLNQAAFAAPAGNGLTLRFGGLRGRTYTLQSAPSVTGPWSDLSGSSALPDPTGTVQFTVSLTPGQTMRFYRTRGVAPIY